MTDYKCLDGKNFLVMIEFLGLMGQVYFEWKGTPLSSYSLGVSGSLVLTFGQDGSGPIQVVLTFRVLLGGCHGRI